MQIRGKALKRALAGRTMGALMIAFKPGREGRIEFFEAGGVKTGGGKAGEKLAAHCFEEAFNLPLVM